LNCDEGTNAVFLPLRKTLQSALKLVFYSYCEKVCAELTAHLLAAAGIEKGLSGLVVFIQRFGSAANLNILFHVIAHINQNKGGQLQREFSRTKKVHQISFTLERNQC
jgi:hypothetical protein